MKETDFGRGGKRQNRILSKIRRKLRPKFHKVAMASIPFDWNVGVEHNYKIKNQGQSESCGGQAGARWLEISLPSSSEVSAKSIYSQGYYSPSGGMSEESLKNCISNFLSQPENVVSSYDAYGNPLSESMYRDLSWKTSSMVRSYGNFIPLTVNIDKESIAQAIRDTGGVIMLIEGQNGNPRSFISSTPQPPVKTNPNPIWAHWMCFTGAKASYPKPLRTDQSWGEEVGDKGRQYFDEEYLNSGYITDCFTFVHKDSMTDPRIPILQKLLQLYQQLLTAVTAGR